MRYDGRRDGGTEEAGVLKQRNGELTGRSDHSRCGTRVLESKLANSLAPDNDGEEMRGKIQLTMVLHVARNIAGGVAISLCVRRALASQCVAPHSV